MISLPSFESENFNTLPALASADAPPLLGVISTPGKSRRTRQVIIGNFPTSPATVNKACDAITALLHLETEFVTCNHYVISLSHRKITTTVRTAG